jgi:tetratricopeptide (TPR) repeat protein
LYYAREYELSLKYAQAWLYIDPKDNDIRWVGARCLTRLERFKEAEEELEKLQTNGFRKDKLYHAWGLLRRDQERNDEAIAFFIKSLAAWPNYIPALRDFGDIQEKMGDVVGAIETLAKAYNLVPRDPYIAPKYADLLMKTGKPADALTVMEGSIAAFPEEDAFEHRMSMILDELHRQQDAYEHARRAVEDLKSTLPEAILHLATLELQAKNNPKKAETYIDRLPPNLPRRVQRVKDTVLADIRRRTGDVSGAKEILRKYSPSDDPFIAHIVVQMELDECSTLLAKRSHAAVKTKLVIMRKTLELAMKQFPGNQALNSDLQVLKKMESQV